jgi:hypothetical protein
MTDHKMETLQREATAYHEAGHAVMTLCLGGIINGEGVEIAPRWYTGCRFHLRRDDAIQRERTLVLNSLAGWRSEWLYHGVGERSGHNNAAELRAELAEIRDGAYEDDEFDERSDDTDALEELLKRRPDATDDDIIRRYGEYHSLCLVILREPVVWAAVTAVAAALLRSDALTFADVLAAIGGSTEPLVEVTNRVLGAAASTVV